MLGCHENVMCNMHHDTNTQLHAATNMPDLLWHDWFHRPVTLELHRGFTCV
jgi:hypothetical protein